MSKLTQIVLEASIIFVLVFLLNYFLFVRKNKKLKEKDMPLELIYLTGLYGIDPKKINFRKFQYVYSLLNAFIITTTYMLVVYLVKYMLLKVIIGIVLLMLLITICYGLLARYYIRKEEQSTKK